MVIEKRNVRPHCGWLYVGGNDVLEPRVDEVFDRDPLARYPDVPVKKIAVRRDSRLIRRVFGWEAAFFDDLALAVDDSRLEDV